MPESGQMPSNDSPTRSPQSQEAVEQLHMPCRTKTVGFVLKFHPVEAECSGSMLDHHLPMSSFANIFSNTQGP